MGYKIGLCQMKGSFKKEESMAKAEAMVKEAAAAGSQLVALPEMWNCPYSNDYFREYAEEKGDETWEFMSKLAKDERIYLIGGSIPELEKDSKGEKVYNTSYIYDRQGRQIAVHRKAHLFDIDVEGGIRFMESDTLSPGDKATVFDTDMGKIGVAICYDVRFPELFRRMTLEGARLIVLPAAFNMTTGPAHWELTMRARALDNQIYFAAVSPARDATAPYQAYGGTCVATPWGEIQVKAEAEETIVYGDIDLEYEDGIRRQLPLLKHRREELY